MEILEKLKSIGLLFGIILVIIGAILFTFPEKIISALTIIVGAILLAYGLYRSISILLDWEKGEKRWIKLAIGIVVLILGIYIIVNQNITIRALGFIIGLFAVSISFDRFTIALSRKKMGLKVGSTLLFALIHLAFALGMFYSAINIISIIISLVGVYLFVAGIMIILSTSYFLDFK